MKTKKLKSSSKSKIQGRLVFRPAFSFCQFGRKNHLTIIVKTGIIVYGQCMRPDYNKT